MTSTTTTTVTKTTGETGFVVSKGTRHVVIWDETAVGGGVSARKFTGHADLILADCSPLSWKGKTVAGAMKWAKKQVG